MNNSTPACSPPGGQPVQCSANQCKVPGAPSPSSIPTCSTTDISKGLCNECPKKYYCCPSNPPGKQPGCSATPFTSCTGNQCKYIPQPLKNPRTLTFNNNWNQDMLCWIYLDLIYQWYSLIQEVLIYQKIANLNKQITGHCFENTAEYGVTICR